MVTSEVTEDALAHTAFDGDADAIGFESAAGHDGWRLGFFQHPLSEDYLAFEISKCPGIGGSARAEAVIDRFGWSRVAAKRIDGR